LKSYHGFAARQEAFYTIAEKNPPFAVKPKLVWQMRRTAVVGGSVVNIQPSS